MPQILMITAKYLLNLNHLEKREIEVIVYIFRFNFGNMEEPSGYLELSCS